MAASGGSGLSFLIPAKLLRPFPLLFSRSSKSYSARPCNFAPHLFVAPEQSRSGAFGGLWNPRLGVVVNEPPAAGRFAIALRKRMNLQEHEGSRRPFVSRISFVFLRALGGKGFRKLTRCRTAACINHG